MTAVHRDLLRVRRRTTRVERCPYCHDDLSGKRARCGSCRTVYHLDCWGLLKGCATAGCASRAERRTAPPPTPAPRVDPRPTPRQGIFASPGPRRLHAGWDQRIKPRAPWYEYFSTEEMGNVFMLAMFGLLVGIGFVGKTFGGLALLLCGAALLALLLTVGIFSFNQWRRWKRYHEQWLE